MRIAGRPLVAGVLRPGRKPPAADFAHRLLEATRCISSKLGFVIKADGKSKRVAGEGWHSDVSCDPEPPMGSILYMHELPPVGGDTLLASMYAAYEALSEPMKRFLESSDGDPRRRARLSRALRGGRPRQGVSASAASPAIRTHPVSGRQGVFVNRGFTTRITELRRPESDALLECLFRHVETPELHCRFRWRNLGYDYGGRLQAAWLER